MGWTGQGGTGLEVMRWDREGQGSVKGGRIRTSSPHLLSLLALLVSK